MRQIGLNSKWISEIWKLLLHMKTKAELKTCRHPWLEILTRPPFLSNWQPPHTEKVSERASAFTYIREDWLSFFFSFYFHTSLNTVFLKEKPETEIIWIHKQILQYSDVNQHFCWGVNNIPLIKSSNYMTGGAPKVISHL